MDYLLPVLLIFLLSNLVQSVFSFGGALVAMPLLALYIEVKYATLLLTLMSFTISVAVVAQSWKSIDFKNASKLIVSALVAIPIGVYALVKLDESLVKGILAITIIILSALNLLSVRKRDNLAPAYAYGFGFVSGLFGGAYSMSGPPVVLYGSLSGWDSDQFRSSVQGYSLITNAFALVSHFIAGNFTTEVVSLYLYALPIVAVSIWVGGYIHKKIPSERYKKWVNVLLLALGANLLWSLVR